MINKLADISKLNCYSISLLCLLTNHGVDLKIPLSNLSSEHCFYFDSFNNVYTSKRLVDNLKFFGFLVCGMNFGSKKTSNEFLNSLPKNSWFVVGMSCQHMPWHALFEWQNITHYFLVFKNLNNKFFVHDGMYGKQNIEISSSIIVDNAYEVKHIVNTNKKLRKLVSKTKTQKELSIIKRKVINALLNYKDLSANKKLKLSKFALAVLNNKYLTKNYYILNKYDTETINFYQENVINVWVSIKFGLQKLHYQKFDSHLVKLLVSLLKKVTKNEKWLVSKIKRSYGK